MERAVNLADLTRFVDRSNPFTPIMLLLRPVLTEQVVHCEGDNWDGDAILVRADVEDERWEAIKTLLRKGARRMEPIPRYALRMYEMSKATNKSWRRV